MTHRLTLPIIGALVLAATTACATPAPTATAPEPVAPAAHVADPILDPADAEPVTDPGRTADGSLICGPGEEPNEAEVGCVPEEWTFAADCESEYATGPCVWLAPLMGNAEGNSFYVDYFGRLTALVVYPDGTVDLA